MRKAFAVVLAALVTSACSNGSGVGSPGESVADAAVDVALGPMACGVPVAATCPAAPPCAFGLWGCAAPACDGYFVVTDGAWIYYYSSVGDGFAGEVPAGDAGLAECPYGFDPPAGCAPLPASSCGSDAASDAPAD